MRALLKSIEVKKSFTFFIIFIKYAILNVSLFSNGKIFYPTKPAKILIKTTFK